MQYTYFSKQFEGQDINLELFNQVQHAANFLVISTFNLAHWLFAYNYWALSCRVELIKNRMSPDLYNCRLNTLNIAVSLINVLIPAAYWVMLDHP